MPVSVTALGSAQLERTHFQNLTDIAIRAPGVSLGANGGARGYASSNIRGLGTASGNPDSQPAVGVFVDGVYLGVNASPNMDTFDLEGIEKIGRESCRKEGVNTCRSRCWPSH